jgi:hypothetical protein
MELQGSQLLERIMLEHIACIPPPFFRTKPRKERTPQQHNKSNPVCRRPGKHGDLSKIQKLQVQVREARLKPKEWGSHYPWRKVVSWIKSTCHNGGACLSDTGAKSIGGGATFGKSRKSNI